MNIWIVYDKDRTIVKIFNNKDKALDFVQVREEYYKIHDPYWVDK